MMTLYHLRNGLHIFAGALGMAALLLALDGCARFDATRSCYEKYPSPYAGFGLAKLTPEYQAAAGADQDAYDRNWDSAIKTCIADTYRS